MSPRRWSVALWGTYAVAIIALFAWCVMLPGRTPPVFPDGDPAIIELYTWHASHGLWAYGPYSRFGWHHPGPLYFYLLAPFYIAGGQHTLGLDAGAFAINLLAVTIAVWGVARFAGRPMAIAVLVALSLSLYQLARLLTSVWNPHVLLVPFAAMMIGAAIVMSGRVSLLPLTIAIGSFVAQTHAALVPCVAVVCGSAVVAGLLRARRRAWRWLAASAVLTALLWLPPIVDQLTSPTGNLAAIAHFFGPSGPSGAGISFADAIAVWSDTLTAPARGSLAVPYGNIITARPTLFLPAIAGTEVILLGLVAWRSLVARRNMESSLALLCALASLVAFVSIAKIRGGLIDHLVGWVTLLGVLNLGVLIGSALTWINERRFVRLSVLAMVVPLASVAIVVAVAWYGGARLAFERQELIRKSTGGRTPTQALYQELHGTLAKVGLRKPLIHAAVSSWPQAAGIALQMTKRGEPFASDLTWLFGPQVAPRGDEDADVVVADTPTRHALAQRPGDCMILERHGASVHLLAMPPERFAGIACVPP